MKSALVLFSLFATLQAAPRGEIVPHVINGSPQVVQHAAAVFAIVNEAGQGYFGGGSIISDRHILTGANLIFGATSCRVGYGATTLAGLTGVTTTTFVMHAGFNRTSLDNDIAIIFLPFANRIVFSDAVRAIALPTAAATAGVLGSLGGFGFTSANAEQFSDTLLVANLTIVDNAICTARFPNLLFATQFCANGRAGIIPGLITNICSGDNGAGFYTGDGMITTTTTTTPEPTTLEPTTDTEPETVVAAVTEEYNGSSENEDGPPEEILPLNALNEDDDDDESVSEQVEPVLIGIASVIGNFWECNPDDPRGFTDVFPHITWIQDLTGIEV